MLTQARAGGAVCTACSSNLGIRTGAAIQSYLRRVWVGQFSQQQPWHLDKSSDKRLTQAHAGGAVLTAATWAFGQEQRYKANSGVFGWGSSQSSDHGIWTGAAIQS